MKRILFALLAVATACTAPDEFTSWTLQSAAGGKQYAVTVPSTVAGALLDAGEQVDAALFDTCWVYTAGFKVPRGQHAILRLNSLNYAADVLVNGRRIAAADTTVGPFIVREFDITPLLKRSNTLAVRVYRAPEQALNHGWVDWNERPEDESMGITGPVELICTPDVQVQDVYVRPEVDPNDLSRAAFTVAATLVNRSSEAVEGILQGNYEGGAFELPLSLAAGETLEVQHREEVANPRIWWSREMGSPELYHLRVGFVRGGRESHARKVRFGLRSITAEIDSYGHRLYRLNGREVLLKAAGWTDDRYMRDTHESIEQQLSYVVDMGLNCIRFENIWGKDDYVYDLSDSLGILNLVGWSCQWEWPNYCGYPATDKYGCINTPETQALALRYFHDQVIRLRNHPAVMGWLTGSDMIPNPELEQGYLELYRQLDYRPYQCSASGLTSSLSGPSGAKMLGPYEYVGPDYWYRDTTHGGNYGFNTETSIGMNIPQLESLQRMLPEEELWPVDQSWRAICTRGAAVFNSPEPALSAVRGSFGEPASLADFVKKYHALDYDGTRGMFEAFRCAVPRTTGIVQWMLNSACPSVYWQLYDWYRVPTAAYYGTKKACAPVQLVYNYAQKAVYGVNDALPAGSYTALLRLYNVNSQLVREERAVAVLSPRNPLRVFDGVSGPAYLDLQLLDAAGTVVARNFYCLADGETDYAWDQADWWGLPIRHYASLSFVDQLPEVQLQMHCVQTAQGWEVQLHNPSAHIAFQNILKAFTADGHLAPGVRWSDNFFPLLPGETRTEHCLLPPGLEPADVRIGLDGWNAVL